jgi:hypothetical protein
MPPTTGTATERDTRNSFWNPPAFTAPDPFEGFVSDHDIILRRSNTALSNRANDTATTGYTAQPYFKFSKGSLLDGITGGTGMVKLKTGCILTFTPNFPLNSAVLKEALLEAVKNERKTETTLISLLSRLNDGSGVHFTRSGRIRAAGDIMSRSGEVFEGLSRNTSGQGYMIDLTDEADTHTWLSLLIRPVQRREDEVKGEQHHALMRELSTFTTGDTYLGSIINDSNALERALMSRS